MSTGANHLVELRNDVIRAAQNLAAQSFNANDPTALDRQAMMAAGIAEGFSIYAERCRELAGALLDHE